jgi:hypothetical protein
MENNTQIVYRDAFLGEILQHQQTLDIIRFPLVVTYSGQNINIPAKPIKKMLETLYCHKGRINIMSHRDNKMMIMFTNDAAAWIAYEQL